MAAPRVLGVFEPSHFRLAFSRPGYLRKCQVIKRLIVNQLSYRLIEMQVVGHLLQRGVQILFQPGKFGTRGSRGCPFMQLRVSTQNLGSGMQLRSPLNAALSRDNAFLFWVMYL